MGKRTFFKALDAVTEIGESLKKSTLADLYGTKLVKDLMEYQLDIALDIYRTFTKPGTYRTSLRAKERYYQWHLEYMQKHIARVQVKTSRE